ncbi:hypothetical protein DMC01_03820 [Campylobacter troglodytis]|nr:hypothetical protein DMC01_03820 [Campylobacter troglodytis]
MFALNEGQNFLLFLNLASLNFRKAYFALQLQKYGTKKFTIFLICFFKCASLNLKCFVGSNKKTLIF